MTIVQGFVFVNHEGKYAREADAGGFSSGKTVYWVELPSATVFSNETPWSGFGNQHLKSLSRAQLLKAYSERLIVLGEAISEGVPE